MATIDLLVVALYLAAVTALGSLSGRGQTTGVAYFLRGRRVIRSRSVTFGSLLTAFLYPRTRQWLSSDRIAPPSACSFRPFC